MSLVRREFLVGLAAVMPLLSGSAACSSGVALSAPFDLPAAGPKKAPKAKSLPESTPPHELSVVSRYKQDDPTRSKVDPELSDAYEATIAPLRAFSKAITKSANKYVYTKGRNLDAAAQCAGLLDMWARADALKVVDNETSYFSRFTVMGPAALALMQIDGAVEPKMRASIYKWIEARAADTKAFYTTLDGRSAKNNHRYWAGVTVLSAGIIGNRSDYFNWGLDCARMGLNQVTVDGALPFEIERGKRALSYHAYALGALLLAAEAAARNGDMSLYSMNNEALHRVVDFTLAQIDDPTAIAALAGEPQEKLGDGELGVDSFDIAWLEIYNARFPERNRWSDRMDRLRPMAQTILGGDVTLLYTGKKVIVPDDSPDDAPAGTSDDSEVKAKT